MKFRMKYKMDIPDGTVIPCNVRRKGKWVKAGEGTYNADTQEIVVEIDPSTEDGDAMLEALGNRWELGLGGMSIGNEEIN